jgi:hypothetical protein
MTVDSSLDAGGGGAAVGKCGSKGEDGASVGEMGLIVAISPYLELARSGVLAVAEDGGVVEAEDADLVEGADAGCGPDGMAAITG